MRKLILSGEYCNYTLSKKSAKLYRLTRQGNHPLKMNWLVIMFFVSLRNLNANHLIAYPLRGSKSNYYQILQNSDFDDNQLILLTSSNNNSRVLRIFVFYKRQSISYMCDWNSTSYICDLNFDALTLTFHNVGPIEKVWGRGYLDSPHGDVPI